MTISAVVPDITFSGSSGSGTLGPFSLVKNGTPLIFNSNGEVKVYRYSSETSTTPTLLVEGTDYTLTGSPGSITLTSPQTGLLTGQKLYVFIDLPLTQDLDLTNGGSFPSASIEKRLDKTTQMIQQLDREIKSTMRFAMFDTDEIPKTLPLGAVIDKIPYVTGTASNPSIDFIDGANLVANIETVEASLDEIATVAADLAGADTIGLVAASIDDIEDVAGALPSIQAVESAIPNIDTVVAGGPAGAFEVTANSTTKTLANWFDLLLEPPVYTFAARPDPALFQYGAVIRISDEKSGSALCYSDGIRWRRCNDGRTAQSSTVNYYIDGTSGNDANAGTSSGAPIKTLTQLKALVAALPSYRRSGLRFAFLRGTTIAGFWALDANNFGCRFEAYGAFNLARPVFDCADVLVNASFTVDGTFTNCYNITITPNIETAPAEVPGVWVNGVRFSYVATKAECDAAPGNFTHPSAAGQSSLVLTINAGSNPASDSKVYEAAIRSSAINAVAADECEFVDLHGKRNYGSYGPFALGNYALGERLLCEDGNSHNIYFGAYSVLRHVEALNCNYGVIGNATMFIGFDNPVKPNAWARLEGCIARCTKNSLKAPSVITAVANAGSLTVTVSNGHKFAVGDYVTAVGAGGSTWLNNVRWYISAVSTNVLTLQRHDYTAGRVQNFNSSALSAWTSGGVIQLVPKVLNTIGFYSHGSANGTDLWDQVDYDRCEVHGCDITFAAADVRRAVIIEPWCTQFATGPDASAYANIVVRGGRHDNTPAVVGAIASRLAANGRIQIIDHVFTINSTGNHQISGNGQLRLENVNHVGFSKLIRGLGANEIVELKRCINTPNANVSQANLFDFNGSTTGLSLTSDFNDFGGYAGDFIIIGSTLTGLAGYQAGTGQDLNSKA